MPLRDPRWDSSGIGKPFEKPTSSVRSPEDIITLWQWVTVSWMAPLIKIGYERQLHDEDVWLLAYEFQHSRLHEHFRQLSGTVLARIFKANGLDLLITTGLGVLETSAELAEPVLLKQLLAALAAEHPNTRAALIYAGIICIARLVSAQSGVFTLWYSRRNYERCRGEMITMIYEKTLRRKAFTIPSGDETDAAKAATDELPPSPTDISSSATLAETESEGNGGVDQAKPVQSRFSWITRCFRRRYERVANPATRNTSAAKTPEPPASTGKILNLLRNDVYEVAQRFWEFPWITTKPLNLIVSVMLVWRILGPASLLGIAILVAGMVINVFLMRLLLAVEKVRRQITDTKLQRTSQFVEAIRHLRWYDWQGPWLDRIMETRQAELMKRVTSQIIVKTISLTNNLTAYLFPAAGFLAYTLFTGKPLTVDIAFPALDLFGMVQTNLRELPGLITVWLNAMVAMNRIEKFMLEPEKEEDAVAGTAPPGALEITIRDASFSWPGVSAKVLRNISLACEPGLTLVCGRVGAGKTALLQAILGELDQHGGEKTTPPETIGYCAETPWLESMSIRENILFCERYEKARFDAVLDACCLTDDLEKFRAKDLSLIGENGVGLSGGQKARVALARAIYSRARILLLDDPIAALDHHTATSILRNLFAEKGSVLTAGRLVILVTHRMDIATRYAEQILEVFPGGRVGVLDKAELEQHEEELEQLVAAAAPSKRPGSVSSGEEAEADDEVVPDRFIEEEHRVHGGVLATVYWQYVKAGSLSWWVALIVLFVLFRVTKIGYFWFLKEWGEAYSRGREEPARFAITTSLQRVVAWTRRGADDWIDLGNYLPSPGVNVRPWLWWFLALSLGQVLAQTLSDVAVVVIVYNAGKGLFETAMQRVSNATFRFYDVTPVGRLMNRLTSDMGTIDGSVANQIVEVGWNTVGWLSSVAVIATATPLFLVLSIVMTALFVFIFNRFLPTSQSLRRLEMVSLSPLMSNFGALVEGLTTVRAFRASAHFQQRIITTTDAFQKMDHIYWSLQAWLQYRFDMLSSLTTFALTATAVLTGLTGGTVGFVLAAASNFVHSTHTLCRRYGSMQMEFVSVERVVELLGLEQEPPGSFAPPAAWPTYTDDIVFEDVTLRYAPELDPVLMDVNLRIPSGANVAVTGRTGSGKSTLALSLLGTLHPDPDTGGTIRIGSIDLATVDKHALRRNITFVAQDPVLFPGTLRDNLDPLDEHGEAERADVLERVLGGENGSASASGAGFTLDSPVDAGGKNLSQGQRQLVGLGRAILRRSPVVVMDEATASIDARTAGYIQQLLREELRQSTVITIAHKKEAVRDADFEVVLDKGRVVRAGAVGSRSAGPVGR
ncbi:P-loop containing nucleoside triphosphate hydrolase protein [Cercophora newfieldiana]|uniref:P-loop containing nucleoside triphosphate hydrolase protein n=1 Tax=Cercophora newfieldiana TaxID=92897 RepID=A0AA40CLJ6_9PEZI|nr:P-loop containing nucleoside triphosphate hydrolase protein [Cercophora newfieldiana]